MTNIESPDTKTCVAEGGAMVVVGPKVVGTYVGPWKNFECPDHVSAAFDKFRFGVGTPMINCPRVVFAQASCVNSGGVDKGHGTTVGALTNLGNVNVVMGEIGSVRVCEMRNTVLQATGREFQQTSAVLIGATGQTSLTDMPEMVALLVHEVSLVYGGVDVVCVTTMIDMYLKEHVACHCSEVVGYVGNVHMAGGTRKGLGTTTFNTVITTVATIIDVFAELVVSYISSSLIAKQIPNKAMADLDILINDIRTTSVLGVVVVDVEVTAEGIDVPDESVPVAYEARESSVCNTVVDGEGVLKSAMANAIGVVNDEEVDTVVCVAVNLLSAKIRTVGYDRNRGCAVTVSGKRGAQPNQEDALTDTTGTFARCDGSIAFPDEDEVS